MISGDTPQSISKNSAPAPEGVPVVVATDSRLFWRSLAAWLKAAGATVGGLIICVSEQQSVITPLIPAKYAAIGGVIFAIGTVLEAYQKQLDVKRQKAIVNFSDGQNS